MTPHPFSIKLDQTSVVPLNEQLTKALQEEIRHRLQPGDRLPASRILAECLGISRNTVTAAYKRLVDEGWCDARVGSGTCVAEHLPLRERRDPRTGRPPIETCGLPELSERAQLALCAAQFHVQTEEPLAVAAPDYDSLPGKKWTQIVARISKSPWMHNSYCHPGGWGPFAASSQIICALLEGFPVTPNRSSLPRVFSKASLCARKFSLILVMPSHTKTQALKSTAAHFATGAFVPYLYPLTLKDSASSSFLLSLKSEAFWSPRVISTRLECSCRGSEERL